MHWNINMIKQFRVCFTVMIEYLIRSQFYKHTFTQSTNVFFFCSWVSTVSVLSELLTVYVHVCVVGCVCRWVCSKAFPCVCVCVCSLIETCMRIKAEMLTVRFLSSLFVFWLFLFSSRHLFFWFFFFLFSSQQLFLTNHKYTVHSRRTTAIKQPAEFSL